VGDWMGNASNSKLETGCATEERRNLERKPATQKGTSRRKGYRRGGEETPRRKGDHREKPIDAVGIKILAACEQVAHPLLILLMATPKKNSVAWLARVDYFHVFRNRASLELGNDLLRVGRAGGV
jgi:hypothetical protein